jgi:hypothetical protein
MEYDELEVEQDDIKVNKRKRMVIEPVIYDINGAYGVKIEDSDTMTLQKKVKYQDGGEGWVDDGYFQNWTNLFKEVLSSTPKVEALKHGGGSLVDLIDIIKKSTKQVEEWFEPKINK